MRLPAQLSQQHKDQEAGDQTRDRPVGVRAGSNVAQEAPNDDYLKLGPIAADQAAKFTLHLLEYL